MDSILPAKELHLPSNFPFQGNSVGLGVRLSWGDGHVEKEHQLEFLNENFYLTWKSEVRSTTLVRFFLNEDVGDQIVADLEMQGFAWVVEKAERRVFAVHIPLVRLLDSLSFPNESLANNCQRMKKAFVYHE
jgi:hypothetical protein